jgi:hypothetical protein
MSKPIGELRTTDRIGEKKMKKITTTKSTTKVMTRTETNVWREKYDNDSYKALEVVKHYFSNADYQGFKAQLNKGKIAEIFAQYQLGIDTPTFDKINSYDFILEGQRVQFKYLGQNSAPSISEYKKQENESHLKFVNRLMRFYSECDYFMLTFENFITNITTDAIYTLSRKEFKQILMNHTVKVGNKLRLRKTIARKYIQGLERARVNQLTKENKRVDINSQEY